MNRIVIIILLLSAPGVLYADQRFSAGLNAGYQYDTGELSGKRDIDAHVQQNVSAGLMLKLDISLLFIRSGVEYSYPVKRGKVVKYNGTATDITTTVSFVEWPVYGGFNFPVRNFGTFYLGGGGSYIFGMGHVSTPSGDAKVNAQIFGYGLIAGIESEIESRTSLIFEWEYMAARTSPVASTGAGAYDDYPIDFSGNRIRFGAVYHFNRQ